MTGAGIPLYLAVLVVDARGSGDLPRSAIEQVLEAAFGRAGMTDAWVDTRVATQSAEGTVVGFRPELLSGLVHPFLRELRGELQERAPLRLRASLDLAPLPDAGRLDDGALRAMTGTHRLLDASEVRQALHESHRELVAVLSRRVFHDVVAGGYSGLPPAHFRELDVSTGGLPERVYLHVPRRSLAAQPDGDGPADRRTVARLVDQLLEHIDRHRTEVADPERAFGTAADIRDATSGPGADPHVIRWLLGRLGGAVGAVEPLVTDVARLAQALRPWLPAGP